MIFLYKLGNLYTTKMHLDVQLSNIKMTDASFLLAAVCG